MNRRFTGGNEMVEWDRTTRRDLLWIAAVALAVQAFWALRLSHPSYFDAYYYTTNAQRLAAGAGFTELIIWQYLDNPPPLPTPSHTYWMPLASLIGAAGYWVTGTFRGAQFPFWLMTGLLPWLGYAINWQLSRERWQARTAALLTAAGGYYAAYWNQPTTFALFAWVGGGCLLALAWAQARRSAVFWFVAGLLAGLGHLTRADGILLAAVGGLVWLLALRDEPTDRARLSPLSSLLAHLLPFIAGYLLIMGGWFWRTWQVTGQPLSTVGTQTIFLTTYDDVFSYGRHFDLAGYLAWGWSNILRSKWAAVSLALQTFIGVTGLTAFTIFVVWAWIGLGRQERTGRFLRPFTWYTFILYGVMSLVFTFPGQRGSLLHSSTALWPWSMALAAAGIGLMVDWIAARRRHWQPQQAKRLFAVTFVLLAFAVTLFASAGQPLKRDQAAVYRDIAALLPPDAVVMTGDPPGFHYQTGLPAVVTPNEPLDVLLQVAQLYGATHLLLDADRPHPLADLYEGRVQRPELRPIRIFAKDYVLYQFVEP